MYCQVMVYEIVLVLNGLRIFNKLLFKIIYDHEEWLSCMYGYKKF